RPDRTSSLLLHDGSRYAAVEAGAVPSEQGEQVFTVLEGHARTLTHVPPLCEEEAMNLMNLADVTRDIKRADLRQMYYYLRLTRALEDRITALYRQGRIVGGVYTSHGMEAIAIGYASAPERDAALAPLHPARGAFLNRGLNP